VKPLEEALAQQRQQEARQHGKEGGRGKRKEKTLGLKNAKGKRARAKERAAKKDRVFGGDAAQGRRDQSRTNVRSEKF
jgi:hypothetical protein